MGLKQLSLASIDRQSNYISLRISTAYTTFYDKNIICQNRNQFVYEYLTYKYLEGQVASNEFIQSNWPITDANFGYIIS